MAPALVRSAALVTSAASNGVIDNRSPNSAAQTGGASPRSRNAAALNDQRNMAAFTSFVADTRRVYLFFAYYARARGAARSDRPAD